MSLADGDTLQLSGSCTPPTSLDDTHGRERSHIWFSDGNIILRTESKQYRVHRGVLSLHSTVFRDMFEVSQPEAGLRIDRCPVVDVTDSTDDWDALLPVFYHAQRMYTQEHIIPVNLAIAMIRLGHKYDIQTFKEEALDQLKLALPANEQSWDDLFDDDDVAPSVSKFGDFTGGHEFKILQMALDSNIGTVLPLAFYSCLRDRSVSDIISGKDEPSGQVYLEQNVKNCLILARTAIEADCRAHIYGWIKEEHSPSSSCRTASICITAMARMLRFLFTNVPPIKDALDPARFLTVDISTLCTLCQNTALDKQEAGRRVIFQKLPTYFGLLGWSELQDFRVS